MKILKSILLYVSSVLAGLVALIFAFLEIRAVFAGDPNLMENPVGSAFGYIFRFIFYALMLTSVVILIIRFIKKKPLEFLDMVFNAALIGGGFLSLLYYDWFISLVLIVLNIFLFMDRLFILLKGIPEEKTAE